MASVKQIVMKAKEAYRACERVEEEWLQNELGEALDPIMDALVEVMYPEQFVTPWEKELYESLKYFYESLDNADLLVNDTTGKMYQDGKQAYQGLYKFSKERERRVKARAQMEAYTKKRSKEDDTRRRDTAEKGYNRDGDNTNDNTSDTRATGCGAGE